MNDPHVVALNYRITHSDSIDYSEAEPLSSAVAGLVEEMTSTESAMHENFEIPSIGVYRHA